MSQQRRIIHLAFIAKVTHFKTKEHDETTYLVTMLLDSHLKYLNINFL